MIFRLGGLGILCVFAMLALQNDYPLYAGAVALAYPVLAIFLLRRNAARPLEDPGPLGPWPVNTNRVFKRVVLAILAILIGTVALLLSGFVAKSNFLLGFAALLFILFFGFGFLFIAAVGIRYGYFPDTHRGRGVSRYADPLQFWAWVAIVMGIGLFIIYKLLASILGNL